MQELFRRTADQNLPQKPFEITLLLSQQSAHARAVGRAFFGDDPAESLESSEVRRTVLAPELEPHLRAHGGLAGIIVARALGNAGPHVQGWLVNLGPNRIRVSIPHDGAIYFYEFPYEKFPNPLCSCCQKRLGRQTAFSFLIDGMPTIACASTRRDLATVVSLAITTATSNVPIRTTNPDLRFRLDDVDLVTILARWFSDRPRIVAEVIRVLRKLPGDREHRLISLVKQIPELNDLRSAVQAEVSLEF